MDARLFSVDTRQPAFSGAAAVGPDLAQLGLAWQLKNYESKLAHLKEDLEAAERREAKNAGDLKETTAKLRSGHYGPLQAPV